MMSQAAWLPGILRPCCSCMLPRGMAEMMSLRPSLPGMSETVLRLQVTCMGMIYGMGRLQRALPHLCTSGGRPCAGTWP